MISAKIIRKRNRKEGICQWRRKFPQEISTQIVNEMMMMMTCKESSTWRSKKLLLKHFIHCSRAMLLEMEKYMYAISKMNFNRERRERERMEKRAAIVQGKKGRQLFLPVVMYRLRIQFTQHLEQLFNKDVLLFFFSTTQYAKNYSNCWSFLNIAHYSR